MLPARPYWPLFGLVGLAALQLVPIPPALHVLIAPGSHSLWHPSEPAAAAVLGSGWRPISVHPSATIEWTGWAAGLLALSSLAAPALRQRRLLVRAAMAVIAGGLVVAVYGIIARTLFGPLLFGRIAVPTVSPFGPFVSKNHFAGYVEMVALLAMGLALGFMEDAQRGRAALSWVGSSRAGRIVTALGVAAALALPIPVSQSRGGVLSLDRRPRSVVCSRDSSRRARHVGKKKMGGGDSPAVPDRRRAGGVTSRGQSENRLIGVILGGHVSRLPLGSLARRCPRIRSKPVPRPGPGCLPGRAAAFQAGSRGAPR